jgi:hypothetical protein
VSSEKIFIPNGSRQGGGADPHYRLDGVTAPGISDGLVDVLEIVKPHQTVEGKPPFPVQLDQLGDEILRHGISLDDVQGFRKRSISHQSLSMEYRVWGRT